MKKLGILKVQVFHEGHKIWLNLPRGFGLSLSKLGLLDTGKKTQDI